MSCDLHEALWNSRRDATEVGGPGAWDVADVVAVLVEFGLILPGDEHDAPR